MRRVKGKDTSPELAIRHLLRSMGQRGYRLYRADIPGKPDIAWVGRKLALFIHGCFWHGHNCPRGSRIPKIRRAYWQAKIEKNRRRDSKHQAALRTSGWRVLTLWECDMSDGEKIARKLSRFLKLNQME